VTAPDSSARVAWRRRVLALYDETCRHCASGIMIYGGVWFTTVGAECRESPDTQHRPEGTPIPARRPATVVARGADTSSTVGAP
jgi:hypothetical protein